MFSRFRHTASLALLAIICILHSDPAAASRHHHHSHAANTSTTTSKKPATSASQHFIQTLNRILQRQNQQLAKDRTRIQGIAQQYLHNDDISEANFNWLKKIAQEYQLAPQQRGDQAYFHALLQRVDGIPPSLAIAQAIIESGWGQASSTRQANNPFGLLRGRKKLMRFPSQEAATAYYVKLLNTSKAYEPFRKLRAQARLKNKKLHGEQLANGLIKYSTQGTAYVKKTQNTININQLSKLD